MASRPQINGAGNAKPPVKSFSLQQKDAASPAWLKRPKSVDIRHVSTFAPKPHTGSKGKTLSPLSSVPTQKPAPEPKLALQAPKVGPVVQDRSALPLKTRPDEMHLTALGATILSSSTKPVAAIQPPRDAVLTRPVSAPVKASAVSSTINPTSIIQTAITTIRVENTTAPQNQEHAKVWASVINAAGTGKDLTIQGMVTKDVGLAGINDEGELVKLPLTANAIVPSATSPSSTIVDTTTVKPDIGIPPALQTALTTTEDPTEVTPAGFVLTGTVDLAGGIQVERYTFHGNVADEKSEMMIFTQSPLSLNEIFQTGPKAFGSVKIGSPSVSLYTAGNASGRTPGTWLEGSIGLSDEISSIKDDLKNVFAQDIAEIAITAHLGDSTSLTDALVPPSSLPIEATLPSLTTQLGEYIELKSCTIMATANQTSDSGDTPAKSYVWTYGFSGQLNVTTPGSIIPLQMDYTLNKQKDVFNLIMRLHDSQATWRNAFGVPGMHLNDVHLTAAYDKTNKGSKMTLTIIASLKLGNRDIEVQGNYGNDAWELTASMPEMTWEDINQLFSRMFDIPLHDFGHQISFKNTTLHASSSDQGVSLHSTIDMEGWGQAVSDITMSTKGFHLTSSIPSVTFEHVTLSAARLDIFVGKTGDVSSEPEKPGTSASVIIYGSLSHFDMTIDAIAYLDKDPQAGLLWAVYAKIVEPFSLAKVLSLGGRSDLDLALRDVVLTASNSDTLGPMIPQDLGYQVKNGFHLYAQVDCPAALAKALHTESSTLTVEADLVGSVLGVDFIFASNPGIKLKPGMASETIKVGILIADVPTLFVAADIAVQLSGQPDPLIFELRLDVNPLEARASASLLTDWVNPFNISPKVKVLQPVSLGVIIVFASPVYPSGLSFAGGFQVGRTAAHAAFEITDNPEDGVLQIDIANLGIVDIISFASLLVGHDLPCPSSDIIFFEKLDFGISTGASMAGKYYPPGATFSAAMSIFGKTASIDCEFNKAVKGIKAHGGIDPFSLGPLSVCGRTQPGLSIDIDINPDEQHLKFDGQIRLWEIDVAITIDASIKPLDLTIYGKLAFSDALEFSLSARISGEIHDLKDMLHNDFIIDFEFEQHILDDIMARANTFILTAKTATDEGMDSAKKKLAAAEKNYNDYLDSKQRELTAAKMSWDKKNQATVSAVQARKTQILADEKAKRNSVDDAKAKLDAFIDSLAKKLQSAKDNAARQIGAAQKNVINEKKRVDSDVDGKIHDLQKAQDNLSHNFGAADHALNDARNRVAGAQRELNDADRDLENAKNDLRHAHFFSKISCAFKVAGKEIAKTAKQAAFGIANGALSLAENVVNGVGYKLANEGVEIAKGALETAKKAGETAMDMANKTLDGVKQTQYALISSAQTDLNNAKKACDQSHAWDVAKAALTACMNAEAKLLDEAGKTLLELETCTEKLVFDAAMGAIAVARSATKEVDLAKSAIAAVEDATDEMAALGAWMIKNVGNIFNVRKVVLSGSLGKATTSPATPLIAEIEGVFADKEVHLKVEFTPGRAEDFLKNIFEKILADVKADLGSFVKSHL